jgi:DNA-directed RNA polymerase subunit F
MAYATNSDVAAYFNDVTFSATTAITDTVVDQWLAEDSDFIDDRLKDILDISTVTASGLNILKQINAKLTADKVDDALPFFNSRTKDEEKNQRNLKNEAIKMLDMIADKVIQITPSVKGTITSIFANDVPPPKFWDKTTII